MPTYDYKCKACEHTFEEWQSFHDEPLTKCPKCKKKKIERVVTGGLGFTIRGNKDEYGLGDSDKFVDRLGDIGNQ